MDDIINPLLIEINKENDEQIMLLKIKIKILNIMGACSSSKEKKNPSTMKEIKANQINEAGPDPSPKVLISKKKPTEKIQNIDLQTVKIPTIEISVKENEDTIFKENFKLNQTLKEVYDKIPKKKDNDYDLLNSNDEPIISKLQDKLEVLFKNQSQVVLTLKYTGLNLPPNIREAYSLTTIILGTVILDNADSVSLSTFNSSTSKTASYNYIVEPNSSIKKFNSFSAFCNGQNKLFISGGERTATEHVREFIQIVLSNSTQRDLSCKSLPDLIQARTWHSMIYIPDSFVFIVGGTGNKTVELYDIESNAIQLDSELNEERSECTLCCINDSELYAFCGFLLKESFITTIERCNLKKSKRTWENVPYNVDKCTFVPSFFSVGLYNDTSVILFGSNENIEEKNKNYLFKANDDNRNSITEYALNESFSGVFREKFFVPINDNESVLMPLLSGGTHLYLLSNGQAKRKDFKPNSIDQ